VEITPSTFHVLTFGSFWGWRPPSEVPRTLAVLVPLLRPEYNYDVNNCAFYMKTNHTAKANMFLHWEWSHYYAKYLKTSIFTMEIRPPMTLVKIFLNEIPIDWAARDLNSLQVLQLKSVIV